jgi:hypothetical protein
VAIGVPLLRMCGNQPVEVGVQEKLRGNISKTCRNVFLSRMGVEVMSISLLDGAGMARASFS